MKFEDMLHATHSLTLEELMSLNQRVVHNIKAARTRKAAVARRHFELGDDVYFNNGSDKISGKLQKKMRKYCLVKTELSMLWRVPLSEIHRVER